MITGAIVPDTDPLLKWTLAVIAGGGSAGIVQGLMGMTRLSSTALTAGFGNAVISTIEVGASMILSILSIFVPMVAVALLLVGLILLIQKVLSRRENIRES